MSSLPPMGTAEVVKADSRNLPYPDDSVDLIVTSPPYFCLRSYQDGGEHYAGQIGDEPTPAEFVASLLEVTRECVRVLKPSGSLWVNLGDKYAGDGRGTRPQGKTGARATRTSAQNYVSHSDRRQAPGIQQKSLMGLPWRYALACIDELGLILRAEVVWSKPNGLPESVTDRVRRSHEQWFYFEQSGSVESTPQGFPFCALCGRPVDARSSLVARLKETDSGVEPGNVPDQMRPDVRVDNEHTAGRNHHVAVGPGSTTVPVLEALDTQGGVDPAHLGQDQVVPVVDADSQQRAALPLDKRDRPFAVDDSGKPAEFCECVGHPVIVDDEPWIPQELAAELMQMVADGEADAQNVADFLSGDYARTHSAWFHFTLQPRYFSAVDEIREEHAPQSIARSGRNRDAPDLSQQGVGSPNTLNPAQAVNPLGKLPGSVWTIPTEPLKVPAELGIDHFAAFPTEWPRRIINGFSPAGLCDECGEGRRPVTAYTGERGREPQGGGYYVTKPAGAKDTNLPNAALRPRVITSYECACGTDPEWPTHPAVVLDPFGGTGTTAMVAKALGRHGISVDMSADYCRLAEWRTNDENQIERVRNMQVYGVRKPTKTQIREHEQRVASALSVGSASVTDTNLGSIE